jgi:hypothetical protein
MQFSPLYFLILPILLQVSQVLERPLYPLGFRHCLCRARRAAAAPPRAAAAAGHFRPHGDPPGPQRLAANRRHVGPGSVDKVGMLLDYYLIIFFICFFV